MNLYEFFLGFRYLKSKKRQGFISFNTLLSVLIVFIGVFVLIVVVSVMNGFQHQIRDKILDVDSHIMVTSIYGETRGKALENYRELAKKIDGLEGVESVFPYIQGQALFRHKSYINPVMIRGMGNKKEKPWQITKFITEGADKFALKKGVYIGAEMANDYGIKIGQKIELIVPKGKLTATTGVSPGLGKFKILGFFKTGYYDFDTKLILMSLPEAQKLYSLGDVAWGIGVKIKDIFQMNQMSQKIKGRIGFEYLAMTAEEKNQNLFYALKLEKLIMTIILFLIIISAGFTIMGTLVMVVMEKRKAIGILKTMGAKPSSIMLIFILEGFLIGFLGTFLGVVFGLAASLNIEAIILWVEKYLNLFLAYLYDFFDLGFFYKISLVPSNIYYIDSIPSEVSPEFVVFIAICSIFLSTVAAIFPSWYAAKQKPVETIRYE